MIKIRTKEQASVTTEPAKKQSRKEILVSTAIETIKKIAEENEENTNNYKTKLDSLSKGIHYAHEYYNGLKARKQEKVIKFRREHDHFFHGALSNKHFLKDSDQSSPSGKGICTFTIKKEVKPNEALDAIFTNQSLLGCCVHDKK